MFDKYLMIDNSDLKLTLKDFNWILSRPDSSEEFVLSAVTSTSLSSINTMGE